MSGMNWVQWGRLCASFRVPAAVAPGTVVPVGTVVTLTFTVTGNWHPLHNLKMIKTIEGAVCGEEFPLTPSGKRDDKALR